jgi:hypothetical protein
MEKLVRAQRRCLDLHSIQTSLLGVQHEFPRINRTLSYTHEWMDDDVVGNLMSGYALVNELLMTPTELFALGNSAYLLELNTLVLCGTGESNRREYRKHIQANSSYFYDRADAGMQDLYECYALHRHESVWLRAASIYIHILSEPQAFIEGNDRTGVLVMSYILASEGLPPFVLTPTNAREYFDTSSLIKKMSRHSLSGLFRLHSLKNRFAEFVKDQSCADFMI